MTALQAECEDALHQLERWEEHAPLVLSVRRYIAQLEDLAKARVDRVQREVSQEAAGGRKREVICRFLDGGDAMLLSVPPYDLAWLSDLASTREDKEIILRLEDEETDVRLHWSGLPLSYFVIVGKPAPGDLQVTAAVNRFAELPDGGGEAYFDVRSVVVCATLSAEAAVTARAIIEAVEAGKVKVEIRRKPDGVEVHFEDAP